MFGGGWNNYGLLEAIDILSFMLIGETRLYFHMAILIYFMVIYFMVMYFMPLNGDISAHILSLSIELSQNISEPP